MAKLQTGLHAVHMSAYPDDIPDFLNPKPEHVVRSEAARQGVDPDLAVRMMRQESGGNVRARSPKGAYGPMQLMPGTAKQLGVDSRDPYQNIEGGVRYLKTQLKTFGSPQLGAAAFNSGPGNVEKAGRRVPKIRETQGYVKNVAPDQTFDDDLPDFLGATEPTRSTGVNITGNRPVRVQPEAITTGKQFNIPSGGFQQTANQQIAQSAVSRPKSSRMDLARQKLTENLAAQPTPEPTITQQLGSGLERVGGGMMSGVGKAIAGTGRLLHFKPTQELGEGMARVGEFASEQGRQHGSGGIVGDVEEAAGGVVPLLALPGARAMGVVGGLQSYGSGASLPEAVKQGAVTGIGVAGGGALASKVPIGGVPGLVARAGAATAGMEIPQVAATGRIPTAREVLPNALLMGGLEAMHGAPRGKPDLSRFDAVKGTDKAIVVDRLPVSKGALESQGIAVTKSPDGFVLHDSKLLPRRDAAAGNYEKLHHSNLQSRNQVGEFQPEETAAEAPNVIQQRPSLVEPTPPIPDFATRQVETSSPGIPQWTQRDIATRNQAADKVGVGDRVEDLSAQGKTAREIANIVKGDLGAQDLTDALTTVNAVKAQRNIPSMDDRMEFKTWRDARVKPEPAKPVAEAAKEPWQMTRVTQAPEFKQWFGKSKIVDEKGEPLVVYHGTSENIERFDPAMRGRNLALPSAQKAFWFVKEREAANFFARQSGKLAGQRGREVATETATGLIGSYKGEVVYPVHLKLENPLILDASKKNWNVSRATERAIREGRDGIIVKNVGATGPHGEATYYGAFSSEQIRSAISPTPEAPKAEAGPAESAIDAAMRKVGLDPNAPPDKAKALRREADQITNRAMMTTDRIPAGQPVLSVRDRALRDKSAELMGKAAELTRQAEQIEAGPAAVTVYHGTNSDIGRPDPSSAGAIKGAAFYTDSPEEAGKFTSMQYGEKVGEGANVIKTSVQFKNPKTYDFGGKLFDFKKVQSFVVRAKADGNDGVVIKNIRNFPDSKPSTTYVDLAKPTAELQGTTPPVETPQVAKPSEVAAGPAEPLERVRMAGAEFDVVKRHSDGTATLRNAEGDTFETSPNEQLTTVQHAAVPQPFELPATKKAYIDQHLSEQRSARQVKLREAVAVAESLVPDDVSRPVGISKLQWLETRSRSTTEQRKALASVRVARQNLESDTRTDVKAWGAVYDRLKQKPSPGPAEAPKGETAKPSEIKVSRSLGAALEPGQQGGWQVSFVNREFPTRKAAEVEAKRLQTSPTDTERLAMSEGRFVDEAPGGEGTKGKLRDYRIKLGQKEAERSGKEFERVRGKPVEAPEGFDFLDLFVHRNPNKRAGAQWAVSDSHSGSQLGGGATQADALADAAQRMNEFGVERTKQAQASAINQQFVRPETEQPIRVGDTIEWNQAGNRTAQGKVRAVRGGDYEVETGLKTTPIKTVKASAQPRLADTTPKPVEPKPEPKRATTKDEYGTRNKVVTKDAASEALARIKSRAKTERKSGGPSSDELSDWLTLATYHVEAGAREFADFSRRMIEDAGTWIRPHLEDLHQRAIAKLSASDVNPDDYLNFGKVNVSEPQRASLRQAVAEAVKETGGYPKERITFEQIRNEARDLDPRILDNLKRPNAGETLNPVVRLAARQRLNSVNGEAVRLQTEIAAERGKANPSLERIDELSTQADQFESDAKGLIDVLYPTRSQDGRNLAYHRLMADATWDVDHWVGKARGIAERRGQNIYSDEFQGLQRQVQEALAKGKAAETREADLRSRIAELEKNAPVESAPKASPKKVERGGGWQAKFTARLDTMESEARARLEARGRTKPPTNGETGAAPIIDDINDLVIIGAAKIARKGVSLAGWAQEMGTEFGDTFEQHRKEIYQRAFKTYKDERAAMLDETRIKRLMTGGATEVEARELMKQTVEAGKERGQARQELARVFARLDKPSKLQRVIDAANAPKALLASYDLSAPLRQGAILTLPPTQWKIAARATVDMFRSLKADNYQRFTQALHSDPMARTAKKANLYLSTKADGDFASLVQREEAFMSNLAERIPGVQMSEHAYVSYLDSLRMQTFKKFTKANPTATPQQLADVAKFINYATGRGDLGKMGNAVTPALNAIFFSPRYLASRVQLMNPKLYNPRTPQGRMAISNMMQFAGVVATTLALAKLGGADVALDPDDPDFLKMKFGNTRYDALAGFQQPIRYAWRLGKGLTNNAKGIKNERGDEPLALTERFLRSKASPAGSTIADFAFGKTFEGQPVSEAYNMKDPKAIGNLAIDKLAPMVLQDAAKAWQDAETQGKPGWAGAAKATPGFFGIGVQTYPPRPSKSSSFISVPDPAAQIKRDINRMIHPR